ncbi:threonine transporter [Bacterioplanes sanyensis]|uniref:LysE family translocator n=1 Tax=Bacterioplanes sanyensis TaxID=1249553 RepID=UPI001679E5B4|nr:LysE family translocator [Bacterioplanes sanyensis]GGY47071.1 threonine transporter [Bacterioplanes sanyensis]
MNELTLLLTLAAVHSVALLSPGPDFALVVQHAARHGRRSGLCIALGLSLGILLHTALSLTGVSYLIQQHESVFAVVQLLGGGFLLYLGVTALWASYQGWQQVAVAETASVALVHSPLQAVLKGLATNLLNPKALVFFVSLMSTLVPANVSLAVKGLATALLFALSLGWFALLAWWLSSSAMQQRLARASHYIDALCGGIFSVLGGGILLSRLAAI